MINFGIILILTLSILFIYEIKIDTAKKRAIKVKVKKNEGPLF